MLPLMLLTGVLSGILVQTLIPIPSWFEKLFRTFVPKSFVDLVIFAIIMVLIIAPCEEMIFRSFVQRGLESSLGVAGSIIMSSIIFGVFHFNPWQFLPAFTLGLVLGYAFRKSNYRIWLPITLHAFYNTILIALNYFLAVWLKLFKKMLPIMLLTGVLFKHLSRFLNGSRMFSICLLQGCLRMLSICLQSSSS